MADANAERKFWAVKTDTASTEVRPGGTRFLDLGRGSGRLRYPRLAALVYRMGAPIPRVRVLVVSEMMKTSSALLRKVR